MHTKHIHSLGFVALLSFSLVLGPGCASVREMFHRKKVTHATELLAPSDDELAGKSSTDPNLQKIGLLQAKASLAELDKKSAEAVGAYESILEIDPNHVGAHHRLALLFVQSGRADEADKHFKLAVQLGSENSMVQNDYGYFCHLRDDSAGAVRHLSRAIELEPNFLAAHNNLGLVLAGQGRLSEAETHFQLAKCGRAESLNNLAFARFLESDLNGASSMFKQALQVDPNQQQAQSSLASIERMSQSSPIGSADMGTQTQVLQTNLIESAPGRITTGGLSGPVSGAP